MEHFNISKEIQPLVVIGAGAAGLVIANGAAKAGKKVLLIDSGTWGGDCTHFGCIPSKSLIAASHDQFFKRESADILKHVRSIRNKVLSHENPEALRASGVTALEGTAEFIDSKTLLVNGQRIRAKQIVIATGSSPFIPPIKGLKDSPFLTNETIFELSLIPKSLIVLGGGPIGSELSQAMQRLGTKVTLVHTHPCLLNRDEPEAAEVIFKQFSKEGIKLKLGFSTEEVIYENGQFTLVVRPQGSTQTQTLTADALLVAVGRRPNLKKLKLEHAGIAYSEKGIAVDAYGRTSKSHIWAVGDVIGPPYFTHYAESQARSVLTSLLLPWKFKVKKSRQPIPHVTFTDPEVASIGLTEAHALSQFKSSALAVYTIPMESVDRALTSGRTEGFVKIVTKKWSSQILGATIVSPSAGEILMEISLAMYAKLPLRRLAGLIHPYPIYAHGIRKAADLWLTQTILPLFRKKR